MEASVCDYVTKARGKPSRLGNLAPAMVFFPISPAPPSEVNPKDKIIADVIHLRRRL